MHLIQTNKKFKTLNQTQTFKWTDDGTMRSPLSLTSKSTLIDTDLTPPTELRASAVREAGIEQME